ncbi:MAG: carbohydrate kinase family protein [Thermoanaerobaculia bacterium]|nr:carbohydrate kinase family protein [Thermoanaerobaculia bacterium]
MIVLVGPTGVDFKVRAGRSGISVSTCLGGVCRNVYQRLREAEIPSTFITQKVDRLAEELGVRSQADDDIVVIPDSERRFLYLALETHGQVPLCASDYTGSAEVFSARRVAPLLPRSRSLTAFVTSTDIDPDLLLFPALARSIRCLLVAAMPPPLPFFPDWGGRCEILFANAEEASAISGTPAGFLGEARRHGVTAACVTLGAEGVLVSHALENLSIPAADLEGEALHIVGAGDAFAAGFVSSYVLNHEPSLAAKEGLAWSACFVRHGRITPGAPKAPIRERAGTVSRPQR